MNRSAAILSILVFLATPWAAGCTTYIQTQPYATEVATSTQQRASSPFAAVPLLGELTRTVVYGEIWERSQLSKRDRSLITIAALQALYRDQLRGHLNRGLENGLTQEEIQEVIVHVSFYTGWPTGVNASRMAGDVFRERDLPASPPASPWVESGDSQ